MRSSEFFRAAFTGRFKEARDKTIHLRDTDIETFKAYIHWVYAKEVVLAITEEAEADDEGQARMQKAVKLYVGADRLDDKGLRKACIDYLEEVLADVEAVPGPDIVTQAYATTTELCLLSRVITDAYLTLNRDYVEQFRVDSPNLLHQFLANMVSIRMLVNEGM